MFKTEQDILDYFPVTATAVIPEARMKSRRNEFRYSKFQIPVSFKTAYEEGNALLVNISTGGCALKDVSPCMTDKEIFLLTINPEDIERPIQAKAVVLRVNGDIVAAKFIIIAPSSQNLLRSYFAKKTRNIQL